MKRATIFFITMLFVLVFAHSAKAALQDKGEGLIYDDDLGITWMQYANYADRKSVVQGKSVDLGGRRIIKKKRR